MKDRCENCKYSRTYKEFKNGEWRESRCCVVFSDDENHGFVLGVNKNDLCECFIDK